MDTERSGVRLSIDHGIATLWLNFPSRPVNALNPTRLSEIESSLAAVTRDPHVDVIVIRSDRLAGFCGGHEAIALEHLETEEDAAAFSRSGQSILNRLALVEPVTVAFLEGPCLGPGWELALACDYRLAVAGPDSWVGFPDAPQLPPCWGGLIRLGRTAKSFRDGQILTAKETLQLGLIDDAFSARRAKVELQNWLDRLASRPRKRPWPCSAVELAAERSAFREAVRSGGQNAFVRIPHGSSDPASIAVESAIRGTAITTSAKATEVECHLEIALRRGRVTPLELDQARKRIAYTPTPVRGTARLAAPTKSRSPAKIAV